MKSVQQPAPAEAEVPRHIAEALDQSADDLRHGRLEDSAAFLDRMQARIDAYKAGQQKPIPAVAKP